MEKKTELRGFSREKKKNLRDHDLGKIFYKLLIVKDSVTEMAVTDTGDVYRLTGIELILKESILSLAEILDYINDDLLESWREKEEQP